MLLAGGRGGKRGAPTCVAATFSYKGKPPGVTRVPASSTLEPTGGVRPPAARDQQCIKTSNFPSSSSIATSRPTPLPANACGASPTNWSRTASAFSPPPAPPRAHRRFHPPRPGLHSGRRRRCRGKPAAAAGCGRTDPRGPRAGAAIADLRPRRAGDHRERAGRVHGRPAPVARHPLPVRRHRAVPRPPGRPGGAQLPGRAAAAILPCAGRAHRAVQLFLAYAGPRRRCRLSQESGGTGVPPVLRGEHAAFRPVGLGPRAGIAARPYRPPGRGRGPCRAQFRRRPYLLRDQWHFHREQDRLALHGRSRRPGAGGPQLPQVDPPLDHHDRGRYRST